MGRSGADPGALRAIPRAGGMRCDRPRCLSPGGLASSPRRLYLMHHRGTAPDGAVGRWPGGAARCSPGRGEAVRPATLSFAGGPRLITEGGAT